MASVTLKNVLKEYPNGFRAVKDFSLDIKDKEFMIFVGPSGCGKSTTMRMIAGLEDISDGTVKIGDTVVNSLPPKERNVAMVFQDYALYPHMTVKENLSLSLRLKKVDKKVIEEKVKVAAEILGLEELLDRHPRQLSGGQRQRVAVGRSIVRTPDVFLFDEPLSNLDPKLRTTMRVEIKKLHQQLNSTMIYVTHDQIEAMTLGDRIVVMNLGIIQQIADPSTLYDEPANKFVAGFIGTPPMNFFECELVQKGSKYHAVSSLFDIILDDKKGLYKKLKAGFAGAPKLWLGIRAEDIFVSKSKSAKKNQFEAEIDVLEPVGSEVFIHMKTNNESVDTKKENLTARNDFVVKAPHHLSKDLKPGEKVILDVDLDKLHLFDTETEMAIR